MLAKQFFEHNNINLLDWTAQSPNMNPIENLWKLMKSKIFKVCPKNKNELKQAIIKAWESTPRPLVEKLALSFRKRALALYRAIGLHTSIIFLKCIFCFTLIFYKILRQ
ncbi:Transposable element Tc3 transposase [Cucumispora dikerogammari]|nr:Transposable element Tc3 transposase [Cucumispora dikerogammari]